VVLTVREVHTGETRIAVTDFMSEHVSELAMTGTNGESLQRALAPLVAQRGELAAIERQLASLNSRMQAIVVDQQRLRENMKALRGSAEEKQLLQRYTRQLDDQENQLDALSQQIAAATARRESAQKELNVLIAAFQYQG
jgi:chromosome segregation ATPase